MKIIVNTKEIQNAIKNLLKVAPKKPSAEILNSVKIEANNGSVLLTATDQQMSVHLTLKEFEILEPGVTILPRDGVKFITKLTENQMTITEHDIQSGKRVVKYSSFNPNNYPLRANRKYNKEAFTLNSDNINRLLDVTYACSNSESTPILQSVLIRGNVIAATDRYRLAMNKLVENKYEKDLTIHSNAINLIPAFADKKYKGDYTFTVDENESYIQIKFDSIEMEVLITDGSYPNIERIIPQDFKTEVKISKSELIEELKIMKDVVPTKTKIIKLDVANSKLSLLGENEGNSLTSEINTYVSGENICVGVNLDYMLDAIQSVNLKEITLKFNGALSPLMIEDNAIVLPYRIAS